MFVFLTLMFVFLTLMFVFLSHQSSMELPRGGQADDIFFNYFRSNFRICLPLHLTQTFSS